MRCADWLVWIKRSSPKWVGGGSYQSHWAWEQGTHRSPNMMGVLISEKVGGAGLAKHPVSTPMASMRFPYLVRERHWL